jgi:hypothetical protein
MPAAIMKNKGENGTLTVDWQGLSIFILAKE